jgi:hypothetical protein
MPDINNLKEEGFIYLFIYFAVLGLELRAYTLSHSARPFFFCDGF